MLVRERTSIFYSSFELAPRRHACQWNPDFAEMFFDVFFATVVASEKAISEKPRLQAFCARGEAEMDMKDLRYFVAVYETKTFSRASQFLGTVQSNVSARIRSLEDALGEALFERHYRGVVPTLKGEELYSRAKELIATFEVTERAFKVRAIREDGCTQVRAHPDLTTLISAIAHGPPRAEDETLGTDPASAG